MACACPALLTEPAPARGARPRAGPQTPPSRPGAGGRSLKSFIEFIHAKTYLRRMF